MSGTNYSPETGGADLDLTAGQNIMSSLRWKLASSGKMQRGDFYITESLVLLQKIIPVGCINRDRLWEMYTRAKKVNASLKDPSRRDFGVRRFFKAVEYERISKKAFKLTMKAYSEAFNNEHVCQIKEEIYGRYRALFAPQIDVGTSNQVEVEITSSEFTGEEPSTLNLHGQDALLPDLLADGGDSADKVETRCFDPNIALEIFSPYSDDEEESSSGEEELLSDDENLFGDE